MLLSLLRFYPRSQALFAMSIAERRLALRPIDLCKKIHRKAEAITGDSQMTMKFVLMYSYIVLDLLEMLGTSKNDSPNLMTLAMVQNKKVTLNKFK